jgi:hypothetical protein
MTSPTRFEVQSSGSARHRVICRGPLESPQPAQEVEQLVLDLYHDDEACSRSEPLQLDLANCPSISARGVAFLIYLRRRLHDYGVSWSIVNAPPALAQTLAMLNLETAFNVSGCEVRTFIASSDSTPRDSALAASSPAAADGPVELHRSEPHP